MSSWDESLYCAAMQAGITLFDTDHIYRLGRHERFVGRVLRRRPRDSMIVSARINIDRDRKTGMYPAGTGSEAFLKPFEECLSNLDVAYLDILSLHSVRRRPASV